MTYDIKKAEASDSNVTPNDTTTTQTPTANAREQKHHLNKNTTLSSANNEEPSITFSTHLPTHKRNLSKSSTTSRKENSSSSSSSAKSRHHRKPSKTNEIKYPEPDILEAPRLQVFYVHLCYTILQLLGHVREFLRKYGFEKRRGATDNTPKDFAPLFVSFEAFHTRNCYYRNRDCFNRPICSVPGAEIDLVDRVSDDYNWTFKYTGKKNRVLNMGSYNYLGFAENNGPSSKAADRKSVV